MILHTINTNDDVVVAQMMIRNTILNYIQHFYYSSHFILTF